MSKILAPFDEDFIQRLDALRLALIRSVGSRAEGLRLSKASGGTGEFRDHRNYVPGEEPRYIDWNLYGRLDQLFLKDFSPEHEGRVLLLLDGSTSMRGEKFDFARRLTAAIAYLASAGGDRLAVVCSQGEEIRWLQPGPGAAGFFQLLEFLSGLKAGGGSLPRRLAEKGAEVGSGRGSAVAVWVSDFWVELADLDDYALLGPRGFDSIFMRTLSQQEITPEFGAPGILEDSESGRLLSVSGGQQARELYQQEFKRHAQALESLALRHHCRLALARTSEPFEGVALELLQQGQLVVHR